MSLSLMNSYDGHSCYCVGNPADVKKKNDEEDACAETSERLGALGLVNLFTCCWKALLGEGAWSSGLVIDGAGLLPDLLDKGSCTGGAWVFSCCCDSCAQVCVPCSTWFCKRHISTRWRRQFVNNALLLRFEQCVPSLGHHWVSTIAFHVDSSHTRRSHHHPEIIPALHGHPLRIVARYCVPIGQPVCLLVISIVWGKVNYCARRATISLILIAIILSGSFIAFQHSTNIQLLDIDNNFSQKE